MFYILPMCSPAVCERVSAVISSSLSSCVCSLCLPLVASSSILSPCSVLAPLCVPCFPSECLTLPCYSDFDFCLALCGYCYLAGGLPVHWPPTVHLELSVCLCRAFESKTLCATVPNTLVWVLLSCDPLRRPLLFVCAAIILGIDLTTQYLSVMAAVSTVVMHPVSKFSLIMNYDHQTIQPVHFKFHCAHFSLKFLISPSPCLQYIYLQVLDLLNSLNRNILNALMYS